MTRSLGILAGLVFFVPFANAEGVRAADFSHFRPGESWPDNNGVHINAHGGGILHQNGTYYWFGEKRARRGSAGVGVYSSKDLYNWKDEGVALAPVDDDPNSDITRGCIMERPKVIYHDKTKKYVMWFHLELRGKGYTAARAGVAASDAVAGPYKFVGSFRPHGNMSRDMTLFKDDDGKAYHIFASRDNYDMRVCRLSDDYLAPGEKDVVIHGDHREAPAIFKRGGKYYLITSACTGWKPNAANYYTADNIFGPWQKHENPMRGPNAELTFNGQSTFVLPVAGKKDAFIFMADRWSPRELADSRYLWLPVKFENDGLVIDWMDEWNLDAFEGR